MTDALLDSFEELKQLLEVRKSFPKHKGRLGKQGGSLPKGQGNIVRGPNPPVSVKVKMSPFKDEKDSFTTEEYLRIAMDDAKDSHAELATLTINGYGYPASVAIGGLEIGDAVDMGTLEKLLDYYHRDNEIDDAIIIHTHPKPRDLKLYSPFGIQEDLQAFDTQSRYKGLTKMIIVDADGNLQTLTRSGKDTEQFSVRSDWKATLNKNYRTFVKAEGREPNDGEKDALMQQTNATVAKRAGISYIISSVAKSKLKSFPKHHGRPGKRGGSLPKGQGGTARKPNPPAGIGTHRASYGKYETRREATSGAERLLGEDWYTKGYRIAKDPTTDETHITKLRSAETKQPEKSGIKVSATKLTSIQDLRDFDSKNQADGRSSLARDALLGRAIDDYMEANVLMDGKFRDVQTKDMKRSEKMRGFRCNDMEIWYSDATKTAAEYSVQDLVENTDLPGHFAKATRTIFFAKQEDGLNDYWGKEYGMANFKAAASGGDGTVTVWGGRNLYYRDLIHEMAHNFGQRLYGYDKEGAIAVGKDYILAAKADGKHPSIYANEAFEATGSYVEDFAESFAMYADGDPLFQQDAPRRHAIVTKLMEDPKYHG